MIPNSIIKFSLGGQEVMLNQNSNVLILNIKEPFYSAGKILSWDQKTGTAGFGVNKEIIKYVIEARLKLLIRCDVAPQREYWANFDSIFYFIKSANTEYFTNGMWLNVLPWSLFHPKPAFHLSA